MTRLRDDVNAALRDLTGEDFDDLLDLLRNPQHRSNDIFPFDRASSVAECYLYTDLGAHVHLYIRAVSKSNVCPIFHRHPDLEPHGASHEASARNHLRPYQGHTGDRCRYNSDASMFVHVVQLVEHPQWAFPLPVPSMVRLQPLDFCPELPLERSDSRGFGIEPVFPFPGARAEGVDRESSVVADADIAFGVAQYSQLADQLVKGRAQVMGDLANEDRAVNKGQLLEISDAKRICLGLVIQLRWNNSIGMGSVEIPNGLIECSDLLACSLDLGLRDFKWRHGVYSANIVGEAFRPPAIYIRCRGRPSAFAGGAFPYGERGGPAFGGEGRPYIHLTTAGAAVVGRGQGAPCGVARVRISVLE